LPDTNTPNKQLYIAMPTRNEILPEVHPATTLAPAKDELPTHDEEAYNEKAGNVPGAGKDGDLGARWLAQYNGDRPELTDIDSEAVRKRVSRVSTLRDLDHAALDPILLGGSLTTDRHVPHACLLLHLLLSTTRQVEYLLRRRVRFQARCQFDVSC